MVGGREGALLQGGGVGFDDHVPQELRPVKQGIGILQHPSEPNLRHDPVFGFELHITEDWTLVVEDGGNFLHQVCILRYGESRVSIRLRDRDEIWP